MTSLQWLDVSSNHLTAFALSAIATGCLTVLNLSWNMLTEIDAAIFALPSLKTLNLAGNAIEKIPHIPAENTTLLVLILAKNNIEYPDLTNLSSVRVLSLCENRRISRQFQSTRNTLE